MNVQLYCVSGSASVLDRGSQVSRAGSLVGGYGTELKALWRSISSSTRSETLSSWLCMRCFVYILMSYTHAHTLTLETPAHT